MHFPWLLSQYLLLISPYSLRVQCLELYTACILSQYHWDKVFHFPEKFDFLVQTITDSVRLGVFYLNLVFSTANGVMLCEMYLQSTAHITTIHDLFTYPRSSILDPWSWFPSKPRSFAHLKDSFLPMHLSWSGAVIICTIIITAIIFVIAHSFQMVGIFYLKQEKVSKTVPSTRNLRE